MNWLGKAGQWKRAEALFERMLEKGVQPDAVRTHFHRF
jgi:pentatricopeptide repeat protein